MNFLLLLSLAATALSAPQIRRPRPIRQPPPPPGRCSSVGLTNITQPFAPTPLPAPGDGNTLAAIVVGRGVQNYTCTGNSTAAPVQLGAVATLYEASCAAATHSEFLYTISQEAFDVAAPPPPTLPCSSGDLQHAGIHYFSASGVPAFDLTGDGGLGLAMVSKDKTSPAPAGVDAVAWVELLKADGTTGPITKIYRLNTVGGNPPATCDGQPAVVGVQYAAQYWVYTGTV